MFLLRYIITEASRWVPYSLGQNKALRMRTSWHIWPDAWEVSVFHYFMKLSCFIFLLPVALIGQRLLLPECGNRTMQTHPHFSWEQDICTLPTAMPETEIQIASDADFRLLVDTDSVASVIQRYVPANPLCPGNYSGEFDMSCQGRLQGHGLNPQTSRFISPRRPFLFL